MQIPTPGDSEHGEAFGRELRKLIAKHLHPGISAHDQLACLAALFAEAVRGIVQCGMKPPEAMRAFASLWEHFESHEKKEQRS